MIWNLDGAFLRLEHNVDKQRKGKNELNPAGTITLWHSTCLPTAQKEKEWIKPNNGGCKKEPQNLKVSIRVSAHFK